MDILKEFFPQIISGILLVIAVPFGKLLGTFLKRYINSIDSTVVRQLAEMGVQWASEALGKNTQTGDQKHRLVFDFIKDKTNLDDDLIHKAIKAAVLTLRETRQVLGNVESSSIKS